MEEELSIGFERKFIKTEGGLKKLTVVPSLSDLMDFEIEPVDMKPDRDREIVEKSQIHDKKLKAAAKPHRPCYKPDRAKTRFQMYMRPVSRQNTKPSGQSKVHKKAPRRRFIDHKPNSPKFETSEPIEKYSLSRQPSKGIIYNGDEFDKIENYVSAERVSVFPHSRCRSPVPWNRFDDDDS
eukprot:TRINITY_DN15863_c0_g1_i1.p1 TRINITY_DN15863_c0_g1~~TRINITY_DN15863_c0_g1_i1.p1  ORF type:complete len:181 (-),score=33.08 TRINITY_DN15863_c0_g1_i1:115-657(-)